MKNIIILLSVLILTSCSTSRQINQSAAIPETHGILALNIACSKTVANLFLYKSGTPMSYGTIPLLEGGIMIWCNKGYQTLTLPQGNYFLSSITATPDDAVLFNTPHGRHVSEKDSLKFKISPNKITYIGDIYYTTGEFPFTGERIFLGTTDVDIKYAIENKESFVKQFLKAQHPALLKKYSITTSLATK